MGEYDGVLVRLADGATERVSEADAAAVFDALWKLASRRGAVTVVGKLAHEQRRLASVRRPVDLSHEESAVFLTALSQLRERAR